MFKRCDRFLLLLILVIVGAGVVMVYSSSSAWSMYKFDDSFYYAKRQLLFAGLGIAMMALVQRIPISFWDKYAYHIYIACLICMAAVLIPGVGMVRGGARSWIGIGIFSIQPAEFMKLGVILALARFLATNYKDVQSFQRVFLPALVMTILPFLLIMLQPDLGTGTVLFGTGMVLLVIAGSRMRYFFALAGLALAGLVGLIASAPYRIDRLTAYLNPWEDPLGTGFQIIQSLYAVGPGGLFGTGLGRSIQKYYYLPEPQTDFIFSVIAEELGFIGASTLLALFFLLMWRGFITAIYSPDMFSSFIAAGVVGMVVIQVGINISVVIGLIPVTGITLPLISYGGSSLTVTLASLGLVLRVSGNAKN
ncbi:spore cortex peptidoglycan biosynthesis regulator SpoVE [Salimicrobium halophilum]|uniref:Spore cortex peptidoglycan biosynthesis regulator SpoVE n=1 Tax=Salimicrobium halophilum TaxID=86666 RepID=A0A1G8QFU0_9BACI|nr:spore cortex peptidoglycan biosynthesis regulator SpoVE [Salimicrobium halophilum]